MKKMKFARIKKHSSLLVRCINDEGEKMFYKIDTRNIFFKAELLTLTKEQVSSSMMAGRLASAESAVNGPNKLDCSITLG
jgi:hypothetical protein